MKVGIYPGSFNPWHSGHQDILEKALQVFDKIVIAIGQNPSKSDLSWDLTYLQKQNTTNIEKVEFSGFLNDIVKRYNGIAIIRGLRNGQDFEFEKAQQYWNEDLGITIPTIYFVSDRKLVHISSSAIRLVAKIKG